MLSPKGEKPAAAVSGEPTSIIDQLGGKVGTRNNEQRPRKQGRRAAYLKRQRLVAFRQAKAQEPARDSALYIERYYDKCGRPFWAINYVYGDGGWQSEPFSCFDAAAREMARIALKLAAGDPCLP